MAENKTETVAESKAEDFRELALLRAKLAVYEKAEAAKKAAEEAEATRAKTMDEMLAIDAANQKAKMTEMVPIQLIKDNNEYKADVEVCWNGRIFQIKRGVMVRVPKGVEQILKQSAHQDMVALKRMADAANVDLGER